MNKNNKTGNKLNIFSRSQIKLSIWRSIQQTREAFSFGDLFSWIIVVLIIVAIIRSV